MKEGKMEKAGQSGRKVILSTLWIFGMLNWIYCDVFGLHDKNILRQVISGGVDGGPQMTPEFLLAASIVMEIPAIMVLLSRILGYRANRIANIVAGVIMTLVQVASLFVGKGPTSYYMFFSAIEISCTVVIVWYSWTWPKPGRV
jgi:hypothetical protein